MSFQITLIQLAMKIHKGLNANLNIRNAVVTSGTFDGVHIGHQYILKKLKAIAQEINGESVLITYWPHPRLVIDPSCDLKLICDLDEKLDILERMGIDHVWIIPFNREFSLLDSKDFIQEVIIDKLNTKKLVIGYDHKFGKNREGSFNYLKENISNYPFEIEEIERQTIEELTFSSTLIRKSLLNGDIKKATKLLGHRYPLRGSVIKGLQNGGKLGFPTANLNISFKNKLIPGDGVYAVTVKTRQESKQGMLNIGSRPTLNAGRSIEVHIFDFNKDIYGENIELEFCKKMRNELKFTSVSGLTEQLKRDEKEIREYFKEED